MLLERDTWCLASAVAYLLDYLAWPEIRTERVREKVCFRNKVTEDNFVTVILNYF